MKKIILLLVSLFSVFLSKAQDNAGDLYPADSIFFEYNTIPYQINGTWPANCWQAGHPSKVYFNEAYTPPLAIVTDTANPYPVNTESSFILMIIDTMNQCCAPYLEFKHKYETDTLTDYGLIEYSFDNGLTWGVAKDTNGFNGPYGGFMFFWQMNESVDPPHHTYWNPWYISGKSENWIRSRYVWQLMIPRKNADFEYPDTITVRFTFHSDGNQTNKEGWMIDNIVTGQMDVGTLVNELLSSSAGFFPNPVNGMSQFHSNSSYGNSILVLFDVSGKEVMRVQTDDTGGLTLDSKDLKNGLYVWKLKTLSGKILILK